MRTRLTRAALKVSKEMYMKQLKDLSAAKPKSRDDEILLESLARLDAEYGIAKDDLVSLTSDGIKQC